MKTAWQDRVLPACIALAAFCGCSPEAPDDTGFDEAAQLAEQVGDEAVMARVEQLAREHRADEKVDCDGYTAMDGFPACQLSRNAALEMVTTVLSSFGYEPSVVTLGEGPEARNVVAEHRGVVSPGEVVLVGAHIDAFHAGADDNSSGVAAMLEVAKWVAGARFARSVRFVGFDLEEYGAVGSTRFVRAGLADDVVIAVILECVGFVGPRQDGLPGLSLGDRGDFLLVVANDDSRGHARKLLALNHRHAFLKMKGLSASGDAWYPLTSALTRSDNGPMWLERIPAVMLTDTADLRNPNYHAPGDTAATLNAEFLGGAARVTLASVALFAELLP